MRKVIVAAAALLLAACGLHREPIVNPPGVQSQQTIVLNGHRLTVHMADLRQPATGVRPLLVYATGDRGWAGKDLDVYRHLVAWNYPVAGFDAHDYVRHLGSRSTTTPGRVARDYFAIIRTARAGLGLPDDVPVVLVGVSRGADLSVVAAGQRGLRGRLGGVVAVALTKEEEYVKWLGRRLRHERRSSAAAGGPSEPLHPEMVELYDYLPLLRTVPVTVIQSTRDNYLPAAQARELFGPDTPVRRLIPIEAGNHSFSGARQELYDTMHDTLTRLSASLDAHH